MTVVVQLTPPGRAAVAVVLVSGPDALRAVGACFNAVASRPLADFPPGRIALGRWGGPDGEELIVCRRSEDRIEVHCHGGVAAVDAVVETLLEQGCVRMAWQDWLCDSSHDATVAAAHIALADAPTARTAAILLDQYHGALSRALRSIITSLAAGEWLEALRLVDDLLTQRGVGLHLTSPWRVVLTGAPNVGKSSLINALAGYRRAIVSHVPGTTRDVVTSTTAIDGWPVTLCDTAGLRETSDEVESAGVALATAALAQADLVAVVHDASTDGDQSDDDRDIASLLPTFSDGHRIIDVRNKIDLVQGENVQRGAASTAGQASTGTLSIGSSGTQSISTSAVTGQGIGELIAAIGRTLVPRAPAAGMAVPFNARHFEQLEVARQAIGERNASVAITALQSLLSP